MEGKQEKALKYAAWASYNTENEEEIIEDFLQRRKGFTLDILTHILQETEEVKLDKLFVLAALGYLAPPEAHTLLLPFVHSPKRSERWISTLSLGRLKESMAFPLLQHMLLEGLLNPNDFDDEAIDNYDWYIMHRGEITFLLADWGNLAVVPTLCEAIRQCRALEVKPDQYFGEVFPFIHDYDSLNSRLDGFIDKLTFALGRYGAHDALMSLTFPPAHWSYAQIYFIYGTLYSTEANRADQEPWPIFYTPPVRRRLDETNTLETSYSTPLDVMHVLETHFHFSKEEQKAFLPQVLLATKQRKYENYPRNTPGYKGYEFDAHF